MRILVCGGRSFGNIKISKTLPRYEEALREYQFIMQTLYQATIKHSKFYNPDDNWLPVDITIICGGATGADSVAEDFAIVHFCGLRVYKAEWKKYGMGAGFIRNKQMRDEGKPDLGIAFPGGNGTMNMCGLLRAASISVEVITYVPILPSSLAPSPGTSYSSDHED